jgi:hypothetical protein
MQEVPARRCLLDIGPIEPPPCAVADVQYFDLLLLTFLGNPLDLE